MKIPNYYNPGLHPLKNFWSRLYEPADMLTRSVRNSCRRKNDTPILLNAEMEESQRKKRLEKIQAYQMERDLLVDERERKATTRRERMQGILTQYEDQQVTSPSSDGH